MSNAKMIAAVRNGAGAARRQTTAANVASPIVGHHSSQPSLNELKTIYNANGKILGNDIITNECMDSLYRVCHDAQEEVKSEEREKHGEDLVDLNC